MITVILPQVDGRRLRKWKVDSPRWIRCSGGDVSSALQEAVNAKEGLFSLPAEEWERIFGCQKSSK